MSNSHFEKVDDSTFRVYYAHDENRLIRYGDLSGVQGNVEIIEFSMPMPMDGNSELYVGSSQVFEYGYNPFQHKLVKETIYDKWLMGRLDMGEVLDRFIKILMGATNRFSVPYFGDPTGHVSQFHLGILHRMDQVDSQPGAWMTPGPLTRLQKIYWSLSRLTPTQVLKARATPWVGSLIREFTQQVIAQSFKTLGFPSEVIHIALCGNTPMYNHMQVLMFSILDNTENPVHFHILHTDPVPEEMQRSMHYLCQWHSFSEVSFYPVDLSTEATAFPENPITENIGMLHITRDTYVRLLIPSKVSKVDKIIYLDVDIIVERDIANLWNFDLEGMPLGMVMEPQAQVYKGFNPVGVQAGVILMDLKKLREENFEERLQARSQREYMEAGHILLMDQGLLQREFADRIHPLPFIYNFCTFIFGPHKFYTVDDDITTKHLFGAETLDNIVVFHYAGPKKGWGNEDGRYAKYRDSMKNILQPPVT